MKTNFQKILMMTALTAATTLVSALPSVYPTGVTKYDPEKAQNQYVVFSGADNKTHLIDMNGNEINQWNYAGFPPDIINPILVNGEKGRIFLQLEEDSNPSKLASAGNGLKNKIIGELDWTGKVIWQWGKDAPSGGARQHHDIRKLPNGNNIILTNLQHKIAGFKVAEVIDDVIYEVDPQGKIVWTWKASDHIKEFGFTKEQLELVYDTKNPDYLHINNLAPIGPNKWFDAGDQRFHPDNLVIDSRNANFIAIIEKTTGKIVWILGPNYPAFDIRTANTLPRPVDQISGQHDAHIIPKGLPGAGNLLVFDNQGDAGYPFVQRFVLSGSRVLEIDPIKKEIVWQYTGTNSNQPDWTFFSSFISSARRLPNGNTLIDEGKNGRFFQVTPQGEIVWEYISPYFGKAPLGNATSNWVYRATPVPYEWAPQGTPRSEVAVIPPKLTEFKIAAVQ